MSAAEQALLIPCQGDTLVGVLSQPAAPARQGLVVVPGGPQYRVGSHRQFVLLARRLAAQGVAVLRFDPRGRGDSAGPQRRFEAIAADIDAAIRSLRQHCPTLQQVVLWGLCDGASAALLYSAEPGAQRLTGLCLLNPWVRSDATLALTQLKHYYTARLLEAAFWQRLWRGQLAWRPSLAGLWSSLRAWRARLGPQTQAPLFPQRMAGALRAFDGQVLIVLSECDLTAREFLECAASDPAWQGLLQQTKVRRCEVAGADHTFARADWRAAAEQAVLDWLRGLDPPG